MKLRKGKNEAEDCEEGTNLIDVAALTAELVVDRDLSDDDVDKILAAAAERQKQKPLTVKELDNIIDVAKGGTRTMTYAKTPLPIKLFGVAFVVAGLMATIPAIILILAGVLAAASPEVSRELTGTLNFTTSTMVVACVSIFSFIANAVISIIIGVRLLKGRRAKAGALLWVAVALSVLGMICDVMLVGDEGVFSTIVSMVVMVGFSVYLNPAMEREEKLRYGLYHLDLETHAKNGTLGLADAGRGFIRLDFFNVFWTFVVCSILGLVVEDLFHIIVIEPGVFQNRPGLLFGPFSPIYGFGAVLMTTALNRFKDKNILLIFAICTVIGGCFEYFVSWFMEIGFGATAWDYHDQWLGWLFDGRTCPLYAAMFGVLGVAWIKFMLPGLLKLINLIPWNRRLIITSICAVLMVVNCVMTLQAWDNWFSRVSGHEPVSGIEQFYADNFPNDYMQERFENIDITPDKSARE